LRKLNRDWGFQLPGNGVKTSENCGKVMSRSRLRGDSGKDWRYNLHDCKNPKCPECYTRWSWREGKKIAEKFARIRSLIPGRPRHVVFSPGPRACYKDYEQLKKEFYKVIDQAGVTGGVYVFHPWRSRGKGKNKYRKGQNYWSPHFHIIGYGYLKPSDEVYRSCGWVYKNKGYKKSISGTVAYLLSHCGYRPGKKSLVQFGSVKDCVVIGEIVEEVEEWEVQRPIDTDGFYVCIGVEEVPNAIWGESKIVKRKRKRKRYRRKKVLGIYG